MTVAVDAALIATLVGVIGGAFSALFAWLQGNEKFVPRQFITGLIRGGLAGGILGVGFTITPGGGAGQYVLLFFAAAGADRLAHDSAKMMMGKPNP
mgnify:FL=1